MGKIVEGKEEILSWVDREEYLEIFLNAHEFALRFDIVRNFLK